MGHHAKAWTAIAVLLAVVAPPTAAQLKTTTLFPGAPTGVPVSTPPFSMINGSQYGCGVLSEGGGAGACISSNIQGGNYLNDAICFFRVNLEVTLFATRFRTEQWGDVLTIEGIPYSGERGGEALNAAAMVVPSGSLIVWRSDYSLNFTGFEVCARGYGASQPPTTPPTSTAPTSPGFTETFELTSGGEFGCAVTSSGGAPGSCITYGPRISANISRCTWRVLRDTHLTVPLFDIWNSVNVLSIDGLAVHGLGNSLLAFGNTNLLQGRRVYPNQTVVWFGSVLDVAAFVICSNDTGVPITTSPPTTSAAPLQPFRLLYGGNWGCEVIAFGGPNGSCISSGPGQYQNNSWCGFRVQQTVRLHAIEFETAPGDKLFVDGNGYSENGELLNGILVPAGSTIVWLADSFEEGAGFLVCDGVRTLSPPTPSPTVSAIPGVALPAQYRIPDCPPNDQFNFSALRTQAVPNFLIYFCVNQRLETAQAFAVPFHPATVVIDLSRNRLTALPATALGTLVDLEILNISFNQITTIEAGALDGAPGLVILDVSSNNVTALPSLLFHAQIALVKLVLSSNQISRVLSTMFRELSSLELLLLTSNRLTRVDSGTFSAMPALEVLHLDRNAITYLAGDALRGSINLTLLFFQGNMLTSLDVHTFINLTSVQTLQLEENRLLDLEIGTFAGLGALQVLQLSLNRLTRIQSELLSGLSALQILFVDRSEINFLGPNAFAGLTSLRILSVHDNRLTSISTGILAGLTSLVFFSMSNNLLTAETYGLLGHLPQLQSVTLRSNVVGSPASDAFTNASSLIFLVVANASVNTIQPGVFLPLTRLQNLDLTQNSIESIGCGNFAAQSQLTVLSLGNNLISRIEACSFAGLSSLQVLSLSANFITFIHVTALSEVPQLRAIHLDNNRLTELPADIFRGLDQLDFVSLHRNSLTSLPAELFDFQAGLFTPTVSLENNDITSIPSLVLANFAGIQPLSLTLSPNPIAYTLTPERDLESNGCTFGFLYNPSTASCILPLFGPAADQQWLTRNDGAFGSPETPMIMYIGSAYTESAPVLTPKSTAFAGYTGPFDQIEYTSTFEGSEVNISCSARGTEVAGNTTGGSTQYRVRNPLYSTACPLNCGPEFLYNSPEAIYTFEVAPGGANISFDTCLSDFITAITVYVHNTSSPQATVQFFPAADRTVRVNHHFSPNDPNNVTSFTAVSTKITTRLPFTKGCGQLSANARTPTVTYPQGIYSVVIQSGYDSFLNERTVPATGGRFVLRMNCDHPDQTVPSVTDKLGLQVDRITGAVSATPTVEGDYEFNLTAVDAGGSGASATIRQFAVQVRPRPVFHRNNRSFDYQPPLERLHYIARGWTYTLNPPDDSSNVDTYFASATGPLTYSVLRSNDTVDFGDDMLISSKTGLVRMVPQSDGRYVVFVVASDNSRRINVTAPWVFEVRSPDDPWNDVNGPNGLGCNGGVKVQSPIQDGSYTCDCTATDKTGPNCLDTRPSRSFIAVTVSVSLAAVALIVTAAVLHFRRPTLRREIKSLLKSWNMEEVGLHFASPPEIPPKNLDVERRTSLGEGEFGVVYPGFWQSDRGNLPVAVKEYHNTTTDVSRLDFVKEAVFAHSLDHENVCKVYGMCITSSPNSLILEFCETSLKSYLTNPEQSAFLIRDLVSLLRGISVGMSYLAEHRFVHRDLTADNVLIGNENVAKIADFGLTRPYGEDDAFLFEAGADKIRPRWTDPVIFEMVAANSPVQFDEATDVWSFGIVAIEVFTQGASPYQDFTSDDEVLHRVQTQDYRIPCPTKCPLDLYRSAIKPCWDDHAIRPKFLELGRRLATWQDTHGHLYPDPICLKPNITHNTNEEEAEDGYMDVSASVDDDFRVPGRIGFDCNEFVNPVFEKSFAYQPSPRYRPLLKGSKSKAKNPPVCIVCSRRYRYIKLHRPKNSAPASENSDSANLLETEKEYPLPPQVSN